MSDNILVSYIDFMGIKVPVWKKPDYTTGRTWADREDRGDEPAVVFDKWYTEASVYVCFAWRVDIVDLVENSDSICWIDRSNLMLLCTNDIHGCTLGDVCLQFEEKSFLHEAEESIQRIVENANYSKFPTFLYCNWEIPPEMQSENISHAMEIIPALDARFTVEAKPPLCIDFYLNGQAFRRFYGTNLEQTRELEIFLENIELFANLHELKEKCKKQFSKLRDRNGRFPPKSVREIMDDLSSNIKILEKLSNSSDVDAVKTALQRIEGEQPRLLPSGNPFPKKKSS